MTNPPPPFSVVEMKFLLSHEIFLQPFFFLEWERTVWTSPRFFCPPLQTQRQLTSWLSPPFLLFSLFPPENPFFFSPKIGLLWPMSQPSPSLIFLFAFSKSSFFPIITNHLFPPDYSFRNPVRCSPSSFGRGSFSPYLTPVLSPFSQNRPPFPIFQKFPLLYRDFFSPVA